MGPLYFIPVATRGSSGRLETNQELITAEVVVVWSKVVETQWKVMVYRIYLKVHLN
jgi:hypothetical protein